MKLSQIARHFRESLAAYEAYRRLGYQPEVIFFAALPAASPAASPNTFDLFMVLQSGGKLFNCLTAQGITGPENKLVAEWKLAAETWNEGPEAERIEIWETSQLRKDSTSFVMALHQHGFIDHLGRLLSDHLGKLLN